MANDVVLVVGATGNTGAGVVAGLLGQGRKVRALARDAAKAEGLETRMLSSSRATSMTLPRSLQRCSRTFHACTC